MLKNIFNFILGTKNDRVLKGYKKRIIAINDLEAKYQALSDNELRAAFDSLRQKVQNQKDDTKNVLIEQTYLDTVLNDCFAITKEASFRILGLKHFDVQLIGGIVLHEGKIAEMKTGEGKTLVATLPVVLNALAGKSIHVVTVNDYLASRDAENLRPLYEFLGFSVGVIIAAASELERKAAYNCNIVYGTNNEFGFDYLRDNMKSSLEDVLQKQHYYAIVDEVDSILIDEARTPLIISGPIETQMQHYEKADTVAKKMVLKEDFNIDEKSNLVMMTDKGIAKAEQSFGVDNLYDMKNAILAHHIEQALKANTLFTVDKDYVVKDNEVIIVDEFTGRLSEGRRYSDGLHQALEAKEGILIKEENQTLADVTFQNYFRFYDKLSGMTGTAQTEATEFFEIYKLDVVSIPTNIPVQRLDFNDLIYQTEEEKIDAIIKEIVKLNKKGQPVLVGTTSIEKSETLSKFLKQKKIAHNILNAKKHEKEAQVIVNAGKKGVVTIATNMAGRGVDIQINDEVKKIGGLVILGTERHESRRIDNQLRGRSGRQGDPGFTRFYLSLEDSLLRIFGAEKISNIMGKLGVSKGEYIESKMVTKAVENAQKKVETMHFESRKHVLEYDDVSNEQRKVVYAHRREVLNPTFDIRQKILNNTQELVSTLIGSYQLDVKEEQILFCNQIKELLQIDLDPKVFEDLENIANYIQSTATRKFDDKMKIISPEQAQDISRIVYLQSLDESWREHLYQMDLLKTGIGLRGYNQKDPLVEFKKESYQLFNALIKRIKSESTKILFSLVLNLKDNNQERLEQMRQEMQEENLNDLEYESAQITKPIKNANKKIPRNSPCPCGSGKKYKNCHGISGPKKGLLAKNPS